MQNNYYFLRKVTDILRERIKGFSIAECYSQNKNELIMSLFNSNGEGEFYIRAMLRPDICCLSFPEMLHRAKRNSVDLFTEISDQKVKDVVMYSNERAFTLVLEQDLSLLFKMHGNRSNIVLYKEGQALDLFNSHMPRDMSIDLNSLDRPLDQSFEAFEQAGGDFKRLFPTFGKQIKDYLKIKNYDNLSIRDKWMLIQDVLNELNDDKYYIIKESGLPEFSLINYGQLHTKHNDPLEAVSSFYIEWLSTKKYHSERAAAIKKVSAEIKKDESYISTTQKKLYGLETENNYRQWADLLMANLHQINRGEKEAVVENFYNENQPLSIPLNATLSPQKNAERFYQKAKNQHKEIAIHREGIKKREDRLLEKLSLLERLQSAENITELNKVVPGEGKKAREENKQLPYHYFCIDGYDVLVGKSARHNDVMLQQHSKKDDLWLHARDVSGSHVIIRIRGNEKIPSAVVEKAAKLAAFNSKRKTDSLCPVIFTQRKYVRKRKGDPPGAVVVDREEVILVEPSMDV